MELGAFVTKAEIVSVLVLACCQGAEVLRRFRNALLRTVFANDVHLWLTVDAYASIKTYDD